MSELIEIEYKILLSKEVFDDLLKKYTFDTDYIQINDYLNHPILREKKYMLRIRSKKDSFELTLKRPFQGHRLETNVELTKEERDMILNHEYVENEISNILKEEGILLTDVTQEYSLTTHRHDLKLEEGMLSLDENSYLGLNDYELEYEVTNEKEGLKRFLSIIEPYGLEYKGNCLSKVQRVLAHL